MKCDVPHCHRESAAIVSALEIEFGPGDGKARMCFPCYRAWKGAYRRFGATKEIDIELLDSAPVRQKQFLQNELGGDG